MSTIFCASDTPETNSSTRNVKWLWLGVGLYTLIFLNGLRLGFANAGEVPLAGMIAGDEAILITFIRALRRAYKRIEQTGQLESGGGRNHELCNIWSSGAACPINGVTSQVDRR